MSKQPRYILITPAHNEGEYLEQLIKSVLAQTIRPAAWIIVDDASTDRTAEIAKAYCEQYDFIRYHRIEPNSLVTYYSRRTHVWLRGFEQTKQDQYDFVGALDADITLPPDYYENILHRFEQDPQLGIATGVYAEMLNGEVAPVARRHQDSTPGGLQLFRRQCYEGIGGYIPLDYGGDDSLAGIMARMKGWRTRCFPQYVAVHHRPVGQRGKGALRAKFRQGLADRQLGSHFLFMTAKWCRRIFLERPIFLSSTARLAGYLWGGVTLQRSGVSRDVVRFYRREQLRRVLPFVPIRDA
ncbi:MAG: glycosyltransferase [Sedimentisphaerales bacterium]|nr:glycosyltransferase [Sedimentisphaerales bacterium]